jgi:hypothetical protein
LIKTAAAVVARFDHDPTTGESLGLLIEEQRTNKILTSQNFIVPSSTNPDFISINSIGSYFNTDRTQSINQGPAPDGTQTCLLTVATSTGVDPNRIEFGSVGMSPGTYQHSFFYKNLTTGTAALSGFLFGDSSSSGSGPQQFFSITSSGIPSTSKLKLISYPNGWNRLVYTQTQSNATRTSGRVFEIQLPTTIGTQVLVWGFQVEAGSFPTSYIRTSGSQVTREPDNASIVNSNIYDTDAFTITNEPFGASAGSTTLNLVGPIVKKTAVYSSNLPQANINSLVRKTDEFWRWRVLGTSFGLPNFTTDGQVTVDWGDGTVETLTTSNHTFSNGGGYHEIGFRLDSGTYFNPYINADANNDTKVVSLGPAPESMKLRAERAFFDCSNLESFDATVDTSSVTNFRTAWQNCSSLTSFPLIDTSSGTNFGYTWYNCSSLTSFPLIDTSSGTDFVGAWTLCSSLTSFPLIDTSSGTNFQQTWQLCNSLTSFPLIDTSSGTNFSNTWNGCSSLTDFPANFFDSWTGIPSNNCFVGTWDNCTILTATSVENILNSIDTSGQSAPASGVDITIDYNASTGTPNVSTAVTNLKSRGWTITLNGVAQ